MNLIWEEVAVAICCGKHCNAANHGPDNEMSAERYCKEFGCESDEIYKSANAVVELIKTKGDHQQRVGEQK